jgi:hypothetical protein
MASYLERLVKMVPPPKKPLAGGTAAGFRRVEATLKVRLPDDYKQLIHTYGCGQWQGFWYIMNPFSKNEWNNLLFHCRKSKPRQRCTRLDAERVMREEYNSYSDIYGRYPYPIYPESGGIIPWAWTDNGGTFFWVTSGSPEKWPTVYWPEKTPPKDIKVYRVQSAEVVFKAVSGKLRLFKEAFGEDYQYGRPDSFVAFQAKRRRKKKA